MVKKIELISLEKFIQGIYSGIYENPRQQFIMDNKMIIQARKEKEKYWTLIDFRNYQNLQLNMER